jgi:hypothetical protein
MSGFLSRVAIRRRPGTRLLPAQVFTAFYRDLARHTTFLAGDKSSSTLTRLRAHRRYHAWQQVCPRLISASTMGTTPVTAVSPTPFTPPTPSTSETTSYPPSSQRYNTTQLPQRILTDATASASAALLVAPLITIIDRYRSPFFTTQCRANPFLPAP